MKCRNCQGESLSWAWTVTTNGHAVNGRLQLHEVWPQFYLGCDDCSETLFIIDAEAVAALLTATNVRPPVRT